MKAISRFTLALLLAALAFAPTAAADDLNPGTINLQTTGLTAVTLNLPTNFFYHGTITTPLSFDGLPLSPQPGGSTGNLFVSNATSNFLGGSFSLNPAAVGDVDTVLQHGGATLPGVGGSVTVPIEVIALSLASSSPITVRTYGVDSFWDVFVTLQAIPQPIGNLTLNQTTLSGGVFLAQVPALIEIVFVQIGGGGGPGTYPPPMGFQTTATLTATGAYTVVPEPASLTLMGIGIAGIAARFRRRRMA